MLQSHPEHVRQHLARWLPHGLDYLNA